MVKKLLSAMTLILAYILVTFTVYADSLPEYSVREWRISAVVNSDGSMDVEEYITYRLSRSHEGPVVRHIDIAHSSSVVNLEVQALVPSDTGDSDQSESGYEPYESVDEPGENMSKVYTIGPGDSQEEIQDVHIYLPNGGGQHTVVIKYRLNDLVALYRDVAVLYWNPLVKGYGLDVRNVDMHIALPQGIMPDEVKAFVYGTLEGNSEILENGSAGITAKKIGPNEFMEITLVFPKDSIPGGRKLIDNDGLGRILEEQRVKAEEMELLRQQEERERKLRLAAMVGAVAGIIGIGICIVIWKGKGGIRLGHVFTGIKRRIRRSPAGQEAAQRVGVSEKINAEGQTDRPAIDLPADYYTPAELDVLLRGKRIRQRDMVATLLDLAVRRYLDVSVSADGSSYILSLRDFGPGSLKPHEEYLINWFFKDIGDGKRVSTEAILRAIHVGGFKREFYNRFKIWKELVAKEAARWGFSYRAAPFKIYKRTPFGKQHYKDWMEFRKTLKQLSRKADSLPLADWERFIAYAFSMGIARRVIDGLKKVYYEGGPSNGDLTILGRDNFSSVDHWFDLAKGFNLMPYRWFRWRGRSVSIQLSAVEKSRKRSM